MEHKLEEINEMTKQHIKKMKKMQLVKMDSVIKLLRKNSANYEN